MRPRSDDVDKASHVATHVYGGQESRPVIDYLYEALGRDERLMQKFIEAKGRLRHG